MSVSGIGSYDEDQWELLLCKGYYGGSVNGGGKKHGSSKETDVEIEGHVKYESDRGAKISGGGNYTVGRNGKGEVTHEGRVGVEAEFPFWLRV